MNLSKVMQSNPAKVGLICTSLGRVGGGGTLMQSNPHALYYYFVHYYFVHYYFVHMTTLYITTLYGTITRALDALGTGVHQEF